MNSIVFWTQNRAKEPSTWAGLAGLAVVFGVTAEQWSMIGNAVTAASRLVCALMGLFRDWPLRRAGAKAAPLSALEAAPFRAKRLSENTAHLDRLDDELNRRLRQYRRTSCRVRTD